MKHVSISTAGATPLMNVMCAGCRTSAPLPQPFTMAFFQAIVDLTTGRVFAYEALIRGTDGQSAGEVLGQIEPNMIYKFDQAAV